MNDTPLKDEEDYPFTKVYSLVKKKPNLIKQAVIGAIILDRNIAEEIISSVLLGIYNKAHSSYKLGVKRNLSADDTSTVFFVTKTPSSIKAFLQKYAPLPKNKEYEILSARIDFLNYADVFRDRDPFQGEFSNLTSYTVTDEHNIKLEFTQHEPPMVPIVKTVDATSDFPMGIGYMYHYIIFTIIDKDTNKADITPLRIILYEADPRYPELALKDTERVYKQMPILPFRELNTSLTDDKHSDSEQYKATKAILKNYRVKMSDVDKGVNKSDNVDKVNFIHMFHGTELTSKIYRNEDGVPDKNEPQGNSKDELKYLYEYYSSTYRTNLLTYEELPLFTKDYPPVYLLPKDGNSEVRSHCADPRHFYHITLQHSVPNLFIIDYKFTDSIGECAKVLCTVLPMFHTASLTTDIKHIRYDRAIYSYFFNEFGGGVFFLKQITPTQCSVIHFKTIKHYNLVPQIEESFQTYVSEEEGEKAFLPLSYPVLKNLPYQVGSGAFFSSLRLLFNSWSTEDVKWYQETAFWDVILIIEIAASIATGNVVGIVGGLIGLIDSLSGGVFSQLIDDIFHISTMLGKGYEYLSGVLGEGVVRALIAHIQIGLIIAGASGITNLMLQVGINISSMVIGQSLSKWDELHLETIQDELRAIREQQEELEDKIEKARKKHGLDHDSNENYFLYSLYAKIDMLPKETTHEYVNRKLHVEDHTTKMLKTVFGLHDYLLEPENLINFL